MQTAAQDNSCAEHRNLGVKLEVLEQQQACCICYLDLAFKSSLFELVTLYLQTAAQDNSHAEHRNLVTKLEALEQRQAAAAQLASEAAHSHSLQTKQLELSMDEHQCRMQSALSKAELHSTDTAEQIADRTVAASQLALKVNAKSVSNTLVQTDSHQKSYYETPSGQCIRMG